MVEEKAYGVLSHNFIWILMTGIIGYFEYGSLDGALGMMLLTFVLSLLAIAGILPLIGQLVYIFLGNFYIIPAILEFTNLEKTWVVDLIFGYNLLISMIISATIVLILKK